MGTEGGGHFQAQPLTKVRVPLRDMSLLIQATFPDSPPVLQEQPSIPLPLGPWVRLSFVTSGDDASHTLALHLKGPETYSPKSAGPRRHQNQPPQLQSLHASNREPACTAEGTWDGHTLPTIFSGDREQKVTKLEVNYSVSSLSLWEGSALRGSSAHLSWVTRPRLPPQADWQPSDRALPDLQERPHWAPCRQADFDSKAANAFWASAEHLDGWVLPRRLEMLHAILWSW